MRKARCRNCKHNGWVLDGQVYCGKLARYQNPDTCCGNFEHRSKSRVLDIWIPLVIAIVSLVISMIAIINGW
jgi:hypothetical protein